MPSKSPEPCHKISFSRSDEVVFPLAHLLAPPAHHRIVVDREGLVGHHQIFVDTDYPPEAFALGTSPHRVVEVEHQVARFVEGDAVGLEPFREMELFHPLGCVHLYDALPASFEECGLDRVGQSAHGIVLVRHTQAVDYQAHLRRIGQRIAGQQIFYRHESALDLDAREALLLPYLQLGFQVAPLGEGQVGEQGKAGTIGETEGTVHHIVDLMLLDQLARDGRIGLADAGIEQPQVVVYLGRGAHRRARIAGVDLLLDSDGGRYALDVVTLGFAHPPQKLAGVGRETLDIPPLSLGIERIECQRRLARARQARDNDKAVARYLYIDILQIVDACPFNKD